MARLSNISRSKYEDLKELGLLDEPVCLLKDFALKIVMDSEYDETDPEILHTIQKYYDEHLPVDITKWIRVNEPSSTLLYRDGLGKQVVFVRDVLTDIFFDSYEEYKANPVKAISHHFSKSVKLPVFELDVSKLGLKIILRYNFYDWKVSIISQTPIDFEFEGLFDPNEEARFCEGFPKEYILGPYSANNMTFTAEISNQYRLYTFLYLINRQLHRKFGSS